MGDFVYKYRPHTQRGPNLKILSLIAAGVIAVIIVSIVGLNSQGRSVSLDPVDNIINNENDATTSLEAEGQSSEDCVEVDQLKDVAVSTNSSYEYEIDLYSLEKVGSSWRALIVVKNKEPRAGIFTVEHTFLSGSDEIRDREELEIFGNDVRAFRFLAPSSFGDELEGDYTVISPLGAVKTQEEWVKVKSC